MPPMHPLLRNVVTLVTNHNNIEFAIIGAVILIGVVADELVKRYAVKRRAGRALAAEPADLPKS